MNEAFGQLSCGASFFRMRSGELLTVTGERKTKRLKVWNIQFFKNNVKIKDKTNRLIMYAGTVLITFEFQKNKMKNITVTKPRS